MTSTSKPTVRTTAPLPCCLMDGSFSLTCPRLRRYVDRHGRCQEVVPFSAREDSDGGCSARAPGRWLETHGGMESSARQLLTSAGERLHLSARAFHRVLRAARAIADLDGDTAVRDLHIAEALGYQPQGVKTETVISRAIARARHGRDGL